MVIIIVVVLDWRGAYNNKKEQFNFGPSYFPRHIVALLLTPPHHTQFPKMITVIIIDLTLIGLHLFKKSSNNKLIFLVASEKLSFL